jgi:hypothetical protein
LVFQVKEPPDRLSVTALSGEGETAMTLVDVLLIAVGAWLVLIIVADVMNEVRHGIENQRRLSSRKWDGP